MIPLLNPDLQLRSVSDADQSFLLALYGSVREPELAQTDWNTDQKKAFLQSQFAAQSQAYAQYNNSDFYIVCYQGQDIGRLYLQYRSDAVSIVDISLMSDYRSQGLGSSLLASVIALANTRRLPVQIHVEKFNPALSLYQRLGFRAIKDKEVYLQLERAADITEYL
ncbi:GNAT family N-acetyltransferase [Undibacterium crateris]|uniref:GNAT family N-acetyltransferase n=1 Tax=Undibacterium crateris TaxID=2528175 RepID=UPI0013897743|nr:GNAT family N-acetyltransferase [Undibacterium crateris]NDI85207.1 GNAT family N-acetyltransferase [Undibacterium crateris]